MRPAHDITAEEENFRIEDWGGLNVVRRDPIEPEPAGTIVLIPFRIEGYDRDLDGSAMARLEHIDKDGDWTGWRPKNIGIDSETALVVTADELRALFAAALAARPAAGEAEG